MAAVAITAADARAVADIVHRHTAEAAVAINAGQAIRLNSSGKWVLAQADVAANAAGTHIALRAAGVGQGLTGLRIGHFAGLDTAIAVATAIYLSGTAAGGLDTTAGTVSTLVGRIVKPGIMEVACPL